MAYLLDANVFIEAKRRYYGFDIVPAFWDFLVAQNLSGRIYSVEKVSDELRAGADELSTWALAQGRHFYLPADAAATAALPTVSRWVHGGGYTSAAQHLFLGCADLYLIAAALAGSHVVVTHEKPEASTNRVKIPNVCQGVGVAWVDTFAMLRQLGARFRL